MERPRLAGGTLTTLTPSIRMRPSVTSSSPAMRRSSVVLPQPDGPTKTTKEPFAISRSAPEITFTGPKDLRTPWSVMLPMKTALSFRTLLDSPEGQTANELPLTEPAEDENGCDSKRGRSRELGPKQSFRAGIGRNEDRQRRSLQGREVQCPERFIPRENNVEQECRGQARYDHWGEHEQKFPADRCPIHAGRFQDVLWDLFEVGKEHPHDDRQITEAKDQDQTAMRVEEIEVAEEQINWHEYADRRHHFGR